MSTHPGNAARLAASVEVLVIGGGVIGNSIAYHVARQGRSVLVVERKEVAVEPAASWASAGGVRSQEQDPPEAALAKEAVERWHTLEAEMDADLHYRQGGHLLLAESDAEAEHLQAFVRRRHEQGSTDVCFVDRQEAFDLAPGLGEQVAAGAFSPADGQADPVLTTRAFADAAKRHGAAYWMRAECHALERAGDRVVGARTSRGPVHAQHVLLATGAWSRELARAAGIELPMRMRALQVLLSTPAPPGTLQPVLGAASRELTLKQLRDGGFLIGGGWRGDPTPDGQSYTLRPDRIQGNWATACALYPRLSQQRQVRAWGGLQAHTFDDLPFIGSFSGLDGLTLALGSWYGFAISPAVGRCVADHLAGLPTPELDQLTPDRIAHFDPTAVAAFMAEPDASGAAE